jgi:hypothetical protein
MIRGNMGKMLLTLSFMLLLTIWHYGCLAIPIVGVWVLKVSNGWLLKIFFVYWRSQGFIWPFMFPLVFQIISLLFSLAFQKIPLDQLFSSLCHVWHITISFHRFKCHNLNIRFVTQCGVQRLEAKKMWLCVKHTLTNGGKYKRWSPMIPKCIPTLGVPFVWES